MYEATSNQDLHTFMISVTFGGTRQTRGRIRETMACFHRHVHLINIILGNPLRLGAVLHAPLLRTGIENLRKECSTNNILSRSRVVSESSWECKGNAHSVIE